MPIPSMLYGMNKAELASLKLKTAVMHMTAVLLLIDSGCADAALFSSR